MGSSNSKQRAKASKSDKLFQSALGVPFLSPSPIQTSLLHAVSCDAPSNPPPLPPPSDPNVSPPPSPPPATSSASDETESPPLFTVPNPGRYEEASQPSKRITMLDTHDGFRMDISKQISPYMVAIHNFWLGTSMLPDGRTSTYSFVTQVADEDGLWMVRFDPEKKSVDGRLHRSLFGGIAMGKAQLNVSGGEGGGGGDQMLGEVDFGGMTWTGNLKYGCMGGGNIFGINYYQSVTEKLAMGGEGMYLAANNSLLSTYTVKYEMEAPSGLDDEMARNTDDDKNMKNSQQADSIAAAAAAAGAQPGISKLSDESSSWFLGQLNPSQGMLNLHYKRVVTPNRVTLGAELSCSPFALESEAIFGAEFQMTRSKVSLAVDGHGKVQSIVEAKLGMSPGSPTLNLSADVDHAKNVLRFGYGLNVGG